MTYNMLRRTKSSSLLPIVRLTNYFYPDGKQQIDDIITPPDSRTSSPLLDVSPPTRSARTMSRGPGVYPPNSTVSLPPDYEHLYSAMQLDAAFDVAVEEERVRRKYACQGLKLVASALAEDSSALSKNELGLSRDLYLNGVEYILRGLPTRIHNLLQKLQPIHPQDPVYTNEPYPLLIFLFRQFGLLLRAISPHIQSFLLQLMELEARYNIARGVLEFGMGMVERGVDVVVRLGLNEAMISFGGALGRGVGETYRVYRQR